VGGLCYLKNFKVGKISYMAQDWHIDMALFCHCYGIVLSLFFCLINLCVSNILFVLAGFYCASWHSSFCQVKTLDRERGLLVREQEFIFLV